MDEAGIGKLQIYSIEESGTGEATCIVRCVGGIVRVGCQFDVGSVAVVPEVPEVPSAVTLDWIDRYERRVDLLRPPRSAKIHLSGKAVVTLQRGVILTAVHD